MTAPLPKSVQYLWSPFNGMATLDTTQAGSLSPPEVSRSPAEAGDIARRQLDQEWQRARERAAVSALSRARLLHIPGAPSHATLHPRRIRDAVPRPPAQISI
jgi:hypothetical protein